MPQDRQADSPETSAGGDTLQRRWATKPRKSCGASAVQATIRSAAETSSLAAAPSDPAPAHAAAAAAAECDSDGGASSPYYEAPRVLEHADSYRLL